MSTALISNVVTRPQPRGDALPPVPWRDPYGVSPEDLTAIVQALSFQLSAISFFAES